MAGEGLQFFATNRAMETLSKAVELDAKPGAGNKEKPNAIACKAAAITSSMRTNTCPITWRRSTDR